MPTPAQTAYEKAAGQQNRVRALVMDNLELVLSIVNKVKVDLDPRVIEDDLIGAGTLGLVEAAHRYDSTKGYRFSTFAYPRIRGAIMDHLRETDALGKAARNRVTAMREASARFEAANGRSPSVEELAEEAELTEDEVVQCLSYEKWDSVVSLEESADRDKPDGNLLAALIQDDGPTPMEQMEWQERAELLAQAVEELPEREQQIIVMYYYEDLYIAEMAEVLGVSESRVSQLHTRALYTLARKLEDR